MTNHTPPPDTVSSQSQFTIDHVKLSLSAIPILATAAAMTFELGYFSHLGYDFFWQLRFYDHLTTILAIIPFFVVSFLFGQVLLFPQFLIDQFFEKKKDARQLEKIEMGKEFVEKTSDEYLKENEPERLVPHKLAMLRINSLQKATMLPLAVLILPLWAKGLTAISAAFACLLFVSFEELQRHMKIRRFISYTQSLPTLEADHAASCLDEISYLDQTPKKTLISYAFVALFTFLFVMGSATASYDFRESRESLINICAPENQCVDYKLIKAYRDGAIIVNEVSLSFVSYDGKNTITTPVKETISIMTLWEKWRSDEQPNEEEAGEKDG